MSVEQLCASLLTHFKGCTVICTRHNKAGSNNKAVIWKDVSVTINYMMKLSLLLVDTPILPFI